MSEADGQSKQFDIIRPGTLGRVYATSTTLPSVTTSAAGPDINKPNLSLPPPKKKNGVSAFKRLIPHFIVFCILSFLLAKVIYRSYSANSWFYMYGLAVTSILCLTFIVSLTRYKDPYKVAIKNKRLKAQPFVSCIVAVFNDEKIIRRCVLSIVQQSYANKEIIIVNDASTDGTAKVLDDLAAKYPIKVIHLSENNGKKRALAQAMLGSKGKIYAFTDSDSVWSPSALAKCVKIFAAFPDVGAVSGHTRALNANSNFLTKILDSWYEGQFSIRKAFESVFGSVTCVSGPMAVFRKEAIYNFMPAWTNDKFLGQEFKFATDRTLTAFVLGNKRLGPKIKNKYKGSPFLKPNYQFRDWKIVYCKSARALTQVPDTLPRVVRQQIRWKKSFIRNMFFTGSFYWRKPFLPALVYYMHILFVIFGPIVAFRHVIYLPISGSIYSLVLYLGGICFIGFMFGLAFKLENPRSNRWIYRPLMSIFSTLFLSWLLFWSILTIRKMTWHRA